jgi:shikimate dehydrogenase
MRALYLLLGDPVAHSRSPAIHARAFALLGIDAVYAPCRVTDVPAAIRGLRALSVAGANVTVPHKESVAAHLDQLDETASRIGAVNCISNVGGALHGHNTDREGFLRAVGENLPRPAVVLGAGGAARAVIDALGPEVSVVSRNRARAERLRVPLAAKDAAYRAKLVVNCTPVGMDGAEMPVEVERLRDDATLVDLVYAGPSGETALVRSARERGLRVVDGLTVLVQQAIASLEIWLERPDLGFLARDLRQAALA